MTSDVAKLIERLELASGPDEEIDFAISQLVEGAHIVRYSSAHQHYTSSFDAALTLVPEGWSWQIAGPDYHNGKRDSYFASVREYREMNSPLRDAEGYGRHATPAIALTLAALKARQATGG